MRSGKKSKKGNILLNIVFMILGGCFGFLIMFYFLEGSTELSLMQKLMHMCMLLLMIYAAMLLQMILHEGGHLAGGLLSGYGFCSFRIGSLMLVKKGEKYIWKRYSLVGTGGQCLMEPPQWREEGIPYRLYNLGGSLLNLLSAGIFFVFYIMAKGIPYLPAFLLLLCIFGVYLGLVNGIPLHIGAIDNDGFNAVNLGKDKRALYCFFIQLKVNALQTQGTSLKDMPREWFFLPGREKLKNPMFAAIGAFACARAMDEMDFQKAEEIAGCLLEEKENLLGIYRIKITMELIFLKLLKGKAEADIEALYQENEIQQYLKRSKTDLSALRLRYSYELLYRKDAKKAESCRQAFEKAVRNYPFDAIIENEKALLYLAESKSL